VRPDVRDAKTFRASSYVVTYCASKPPAPLMLIVCTGPLALYGYVRVMLPGDDTDCTSSFAK
jgi:hypothetical protein